MIDDPLQMNDWGIKKFLIAVCAFQISVLGLAEVSSLGITIPMIPQIVGFIYLTFFPGDHYPSHYEDASLGFNRYFALHCRVESYF